MNQCYQQSSVSIGAGRCACLQLRQVVFVLLCVATFFVPWEEMLIIPGFKTVIFAISSVALMMAVMALVIRSSFRRPPLVWLVLLAFAYWCFLSLFWTLDTAGTRGRIVTYVSLLLFVWMIGEFIDSRYRLLWLLRSFLLGSCVTTVLMFQTYFAIRAFMHADDARYRAAGLDPNTLAAMLGIAIIIAGYLATSISSRYRSIYWFFIPPACVAVLLTGSRGGALALVVALGVVLLLSGSRSWKTVAAFVVVAGIVVWLVPHIVPAGLLERATEGTESHTFQLRYEQWQLGFKIWSQHLLQGVGPGAFVAAAVEGGGRAFVAHNTFVQILTENGLVGLGVMLFAWALLLHTALHLPRRERLLWLGVSLTWVVAAVGLSLEYAKFTWCLYAWIMVQPACFDPSEAMQTGRMSPLGSPPVLQVAPRRGVMAP